MRRIARMPARAWAAHRLEPRLAATYLRALADALPPDDWRQIVARAVKQAKEGDSDARNFVERNIPRRATANAQPVSSPGTALDRGSGVADNADGVGEDDKAALISKLLAPMVRSGSYREHFSRWEREGFHVTPNDFYQPIPNSEELTPDLWERESPLHGIDMNDAVQLRHLREVFPRYAAECDFPREQSHTAYEFHFMNPTFDGLDALALHAMVREYRPKRILEIGSGYSTRVLANAALLNGDTELISIDLYPGEVVRNGFPGLSALVDHRVQDVDRALFGTLRENDILFIDTSHVVRTGGEVNLLFLEVIPALSDGVLVHVHDIFLPREYPRPWVLDLRIFWSEQYLLQAFLTHNSAFEVMFANSYIGGGGAFNDELEAAFPGLPWGRGMTSFWMRKRPTPLTTQPLEIASPPNGAG